LGGYRRNKSVSQIDKSLDSKKSRLSRKTRSRYALNMSKEKKKRTKSALSGKSSLSLIKSNCAACNNRNSRSPRPIPLRNPRVNKVQSSILVSRKQSLKVRAELEAQKNNASYETSDENMQGKVKVPPLNLDNAISNNALDPIHDRLVAVSARPDIMRREVAKQRIANLKQKKSNVDRVIQRDQGWASDSESPERFELPVRVHPKLSNIRHAHQ
jgi:hypothetical protein